MLKNTNRIDFLDYMRVFAFSSVLIGHKFMPDLIELSASNSTHITFRIILDAVVSLCFGGAAGVAVFFLTSGYIITHVLRSESALEFAVKRLFRIYPLYMVAVALEIVMNTYIFLIPAPSYSVIIQRMLLVGDLFDTPYGLGSVEWTLRIEVTFYAIMIALKFFGAMARPSVLPYVYVSLSVILYLIDPFPEYAGWTNGYMNIFLPILFIGSILYIYETSGATVSTCAWSSIAILFCSLSYSSKVNEALSQSNFIALSIFVFD